MDAYNEDMMQAIASQVKSAQTDAIHEALVASGCSCRDQGRGTKG
jgi:hypothetical protein